MTNLIHDTRSTLLAHALRLFSARGYDAVGVQELVEASNVTKPTLYHYFGSKRGVLEALLGEYFHQLLAVVERAAAYNGDLSLTLTRVFAVYFQFAQEHNRFYRMQLAMWFAPPESEVFQAIAGFNERQQQILEELFMAAVIHHGNMRGRHQQYAATLLGTINTYISLYLNGYVAFNDELLYRAVHQFMHGIYS